MATGKLTLRKAPLYAVFTLLLFCLFVLARCQSARGSTQRAGAPADVQSVPVLMYHHLLRDAENTRYRGNSIVTTVEAFGEQLHWLKENGYETISLGALEAFLYDNGPLPPKPVMITFDDGYLSNALYAAPLLRDAGFTAVVFPVTGKLSQQPESFRADQINMLDPATMQQAGDVFEYASHTHNLHRTAGSGRSALTDAASAEIQADLSASLAVIAGLPSGSTHAFSYPYGFANDKVKKILRENGVRIAFRASAGRLTRDSDPYALPRYAVSEAVDMAQFRQFFGA